MSSINEEKFNTFHASLPEDETTATTTRKQIRKAQQIFILTGLFYFLQ